MDAHELARRAHIAKQLKAARWIAGELKPAKGKNGKPHKVGFVVHQVSQVDLAKRSPLPENEITGSLIGSIERMERHAAPMELDALAKALGVEPDWFAFTPGDLDAAEALLRAAASVGRELRSASAAMAEAEDARGRRRRGRRGGGA